MIGRILLIGSACGLVYACARDQAKQDFQREAALESRVYNLEQHVRALEVGHGKATAAPTVPPANAAPNAP